ncbi:MAG: hypothetical protein DDT33_01517 [Firmicutes bacterium]|nr:hypothetical protein [Bacillota bacterium]
MEKVVRIPEGLYRKAKAKSASDGVSMSKAIDMLTGDKPLPEDVDAFIPSCAIELGVKMPKDTRWIKQLAEVLPPGLRGKLEPYTRVLECAEARVELRKFAEEHLSEVATEEHLDEVAAEDHLSDVAACGVKPDEPGDSFDRVSW